MYLPRRALNLFYYNIFRFECYAQYVIGYPVSKLVKLVGLKENIERRARIKQPTYDLDEYALSTLNDPRGGVSLLSSGMHVTVLVILALFTLLNLIGGIWRLGVPTFWTYGAIVSAVIGVVVSNFFLAPTDRTKYLKDFREFEKRSRKQKRTDALVTFVLVIGIWSVFILSSWFYFQTFRR
jgi:hypothetical protein